MNRSFNSRLHIPRIVWSVIALFAAGILGYAIYMVIVSNESALLTAVVESVSVDDGILADCVLIRDEEIIYKQDGRVYYPVVQNGERISAGSSIAVSFSSQENLEKYKQLTEARTRLALYQSLSQTDNTPSALPSLNHGIYSLLRTYSAFSDGGILEHDLSSVFFQMESQILKRELSLKDGSLQTVMAELKQSISTLQASLDADMQPLKTNTAGYYVQSADGYEPLLTLAFVDEMTVSSLQKKREFPASTITSNTVFGKMVYGYTWYAAVPLSDTESARLSVDTSYPLQIAGDRVTASVTRLERDASANAVLAVFRCDVPLSNMASERDQQCTIILDTYTGFKISQEGLRVLDGSPGVYVLEGAKAVFKPVRILYTGDSYYIVESNSTDKKQLFLYDEIILGRTDLYDGKIVK